MEIQKKFTPSQCDLAELNGKFWGFVSAKFPNLPSEAEDKTFLFSLVIDSKFIGGISGNVYWNGLEIDTLWIDERHRGKGAGKCLLAEAEDYAKRNGAVIAFLKTVDANEFYEKNGYQIYGQLEDRPIGTILYHMKKRLDDKKSL